MSQKRSGDSRQVSRSILASFIGATGMLLGCQDADFATGPGDTGRPVTVFSAVRPAEAEFMAIAREIPSFAGYYVDESGTLVGAVSDAGDERRVSSRLGEVAETIDRQSRAGVRARGVRTRVVDFTFIELAAWRDAATAHVLGKIPGVVSTDADEARNRLTLGVLKDDAERTERDAMQRLSQLGVPRSAIRFERTDPYVEYRAGTAAIASLIASPALTMAPPEGYSTLRGTAVPFIGGVGVDPVPLGLNCTSTLGVDYAGSRHLLVASHCTNATYVLDGHVFYQADGSRIGAESVDPQYTIVRNGYPARYGDVALVSVDAGVPVRRGAIARATGRNGGGGGGGDGPLTINQALPFFSVTGVSGGNLYGQTMQKVGQMTGWTYGKVTQSCTDIQSSTTGYWKLCSFRADMVSRGGDSGAPGFLWDNENGATFAGTLWGGTGSSAAFSYHSGFTQDLGQGPGAIVYRSDISVGYPDVSSSYTSGGTATLRWSPVSVSNSSYPTEYVIFKERCEAYGSCTYPTEIYRGTATQFNDVRENAVRSFAGSYCPSYAPTVRYTVEARNMGIKSPSVACFELYSYQSGY